MFAKRFGAWLKKMRAPPTKPQAKWSCCNPRQEGLGPKLLSGYPHILRHKERSLELDEMDLVTENMVKNEQGHSATRSMRFESPVFQPIWYIWSTVTDQHVRNCQSCEGCVVHLCPRIRQTTPPRNHWVYLSKRSYGSQLLMLGAFNISISDGLNLYHYWEHIP